VTGGTGAIGALAAAELPMTILKPEHAAILQAAAADGGVAADTVDKRYANALVKKGYLLSMPRDGEPSALQITQEGRAAAGLAHELPATDAADDPSPPAPTHERPASKTALMRALLERPEGASVEQMSEATGWLPHSVRGFMAGTLKKKLALTLISEKVDGVRTYRIAA
jgi:hypothetical protein